ncbi:hypothetical protein J6590_028620 [Homalodisca vitripennis]|nr:hypothetical protein J6590_028620 [Homalodisca vitripennis]
MYYCSSPWATWSERYYYGKYVLKCLTEIPLPHSALEGRTGEGLKCNKNSLNTFPTIRSSKTSQGWTFEHNLHTVMNTFEKCIFPFSSTLCKLASLALRLKIIRFGVLDNHVDLGNAPMICLINPQSCVHTLSKAGLNFQEGQQILHFDANRDRLLSYATVGPGPSNPRKNVPSSIFLSRSISAVEDPNRAIVDSMVTTVEYFDLSAKQNVVPRALSEILYRIEIFKEDVQPENQFGC